MGATILPGGTLEKEDARDEWARTFIKACSDKGIYVVAITDHHDVALVSYIQKAGAASMPPVVVYPGVEVTCSDDAQCLVIFDPNEADEVLRKFLSRLPDVMPSPDHEERTCEILPAGITVAQLHSLIQDDICLRDACILFPHFGNEGAHKTVNKAGHHIRFANLETDGVYIEEPFDQLTQSTLDKAYGKIEQWGNRRRAILVTGDARSDTFDRLGLYDCWIKLGEPNLEGLRQALLADEARIAYEEPQEPLERIVEMTVKSTLTGPAPVTIKFNPGFNAIIGGRGSGKSAILEYLRFGLARTERDLENESDLQREEQLIEETLDEGFVEVTIEREGVGERWRRDLRRDQIEVTPSSGSRLVLSLAEARSRFRGRAFFQKQLSTTTRNAESAVEQITGIAAAEQLDKKRAIDQEIVNAQRNVKTTLQQAVAHWQNRFEQSRASTAAADLMNRIASIGERLKAEGVSEEHRKIIADEPRYAQGRNLLSLANSILPTETETLELARRHSLFFPLDQYPEASTFPEIARMIDRINETREQIRAKLTEAMSLVDRLAESITVAEESYNLREDAFEKELATAVDYQKKHKLLLEENGRLNSELRNITDQISKLATRAQASEGSQQAFQDSRDKLKKLVASRRAILTEAANQVADKSSALLKAKLKKDPSPSQYCESIQSLMDRATVHSVFERCTSWVQQIVKDNPDDAWDAICESMLEIYKDKIAAGLPVEPDNVLDGKLKSFLAIDGGTTERQRKKIYDNINDATVGDILAAVPNDYIAMTYVDSGRSMDFAKASPGQQASALLELLLKQSAGTLIIDQPEDDLDNRVIMRIVDLIRLSKSHRQLIFSTHNPNMVVNGDADKVIALKAGDPVIGNQPENPRVEILEDGAIETPAVCKVITDIMEGGKDAFDLRSRKYRFDGRKREED